MKRFSFLFILLIIFIQSLYAQGYKVSTDKTDPFSIAFVHLMNCAANNFNQCTGKPEEITGTMKVYRLIDSFPQTSYSNVIMDENTNYAEVSFGLFFEKDKAKKSIKILIEKIRTALGSQLNVRHELLSGPDSAFFLASLGIKDKNGYFEPNIEISVYRRNYGEDTSRGEWMIKSDAQPISYTLRLKIDGGIPSYYFNVQPQVIMRETPLTSTLRYLVKAAENDFDSLHNSKENISVSKKRDSILINGFPVVMNYRGQHFSAEVRTSIPDRTSSYDGPWEIYKHITESALNNKYSYFASPNQRWNIVYFRRDDVHQYPTIYLNMTTENGQLVFSISVTSGFSHPVKRSASLDD